MWSDFPTGKYQTILADPPWDFRAYSSKGDGRSAKQHYETQKDMSSLPIPEIADENCALFLWVTDTHLNQAFPLIEKWGFKFKTVAFHWVKVNKNLTPFMGMGYWTRANPEMCLLATKGRPQRKSRRVPRLIVAPRREHSRKPDEQYERIESLVDGPYVELFARYPRAGWEGWGQDYGLMEWMEG